MRSVGLFCGFLISNCALAATGAAADRPAVVAQAADEPTPYDAGYAFAASKACPTATLLRPVGPEAQANEQFKRGMAMFDHYVAVQTTEGACKAALNLYNDATGKAAKLLHVK